MPSHFYFKFYYGVMLPKICYAMGVRQIHHKEVVSMLHEAFKTYFNVETVADFTDGEFSKYLSQISMICNREMGMLLPMFREPDNADELSMKEWLELHKFIEKQTS